MRKKVFGAKLSRERATRGALFVSLVESLVIYGSIKTTKPKAKAIIGMVDKLVILSKKGTLASKRQILKKLRGNKKVSTLLWTDIAKTFAHRRSGFTRIVPLLQRKGDLAQMVRLEFVEQIQRGDREKVIGDSKTKTKPKPKT